MEAYRSGAHAHRADPGRRDRCRRVRRVPDAGHLRRCPAPPVRAAVRVSRRHAARRRRRYRCRCLGGRRGDPVARRRHRARPGPAALDVGCGAGHRAPASLCGATWPGSCAGPRARGRPGHGVVRARRAARAGADLAAGRGGRCRGDRGGRRTRYAGRVRADHRGAGPVVATRLRDRGALPAPGGCPLAAGDWCHFGARVNRSALHRRVKEADLGYEDEKFSYVAAGGGRSPTGIARVLRRPAQRKGLVSLRLCRPDGTAGDRIVTKRAATCTGCPGHRVGRPVPSMTCRCRVGCSCHDRAAVWASSMPIANPA